MVDVLTKLQRSFNMSRIRCANTKPEMVVRCLVHSLGFRYRLHQKDLPGKPDIVLRRHKKIIFIHGCYWHMHTCKYGKVKPATNVEFWEKKRSGNKERDKKNIAALRKMGWKVLVVWECQLKDVDKLTARIERFLGGE